MARMRLYERTDADRIDWDAESGRRDPEGPRWGMTKLILILAAWYLIALEIVVPPFEPMLRDAGVDLSIMTRLLFHLRLPITIPLWIAASLVLIGKEKVPLGKTQRKVIDWVFLAWLLLSVIYAVVSLLLPLGQIIDRAAP